MIINKGKTAQLEVSNSFDHEGEIEINLRDRNGVNAEEQYMFLTRPEVVELHKHLTNLLDATPAQK